jgi:hypothetical protein
MGAWSRDKDPVLYRRKALYKIKMGKDGYQLPMK